MGRCLPRSRSATMAARRPTTRPLASIITHFFCTSAGLAENVVMAITSRLTEGALSRPAAALTPRVICGQRLHEFKMLELQCLILQVNLYLKAGFCFSPRTLHSDI